MTFSSENKSNLSILDQNILHGLWGECDGDYLLYDEAEMMFFKFRNQHIPSIDAELRTLGWIAVCRMLHFAIPKATEGYGKTKSGIPAWTGEIEESLYQFFRTRYTIYIPKMDRELRYLCLTSLNCPSDRWSGLKNENTVANQGGTIAMEQSSTSTTTTEK